MQLFVSGSYFASDASYSHQYTDLRRSSSSGLLRSGMSLPVQLSMMPPSALLFHPMNVNFGQLGMPPSSSGPCSNHSQQLGQVVQFHPMNLSHNPQGSNPQTSSQQGPVPGSPTFLPLQGPGSSNIGNSHSGQGLQIPPPSQGPGFQQQQPTVGNTQSVGQQPGTSINPVCPHINCKLNKCYQRNRLLAKPVAIKNISGLASTALGTSMDLPPEPERRKAKMFLARVLVGKYTVGQPKYRKPPPLQPDDPCSKFYDSCVDRDKNPKIFVIFDSAQAYPEYLIEYAS